MFFKICLTTCDLQIVLDEEQAIRYLVKYASAQEACSENLNKLLLSRVPFNNKTEEELKEQPHQELYLPVSGPTLIIKIAIHSLGKQYSPKQDIIHLLLQENIYVSDFYYTSINLNKPDFRILRLRNQNMHQYYFSKFIWSLWFTST